MTGTQSLSFMQLQTIHDEVQRLEIAARCSQRSTSIAGGQRVYHGQPVSIVIHNVERAHRTQTVEGIPRKRFAVVPEFLPDDTDKRVQINRAYADSETFWIKRNGEIVRRPRPVN